MGKIGAFVTKIVEKWKYRRIYNQIRGKIPKPEFDEILKDTGGLQKLLNDCVGDIRVASRLVDSLRLALKTKQ